VQNPRPRKYASDAERQAAFRNRASMLEFRADEKTAEKLTEIANTLDISRSDLLLSMVKFALTNHQWARFGLTHKTLPRYEENPIMATTQGALEKSIFWQNQVLKQSRDPKQKERVKKAIEKLQAELDSLMERKTNPTTKKFSPAQIAAQKLFAERARAGTLGKTVKRNPEAIPYAKADVEKFYLGGKMYAEIVKKSNNSYDYVVYQMYSTGVPGEKPREQFFDSKNYKTKAGAMRGLEKYVQRLGYKINPDKAKPRAYVKRVSQATGAPPSKRLQTRRKKALTAPAGYFPNPGSAMMTAYQVICMHPKQHVVGIFKTMAEAKQIATAMANAKGVAYAVKTVKVHKAHFAA